MIWVVGYMILLSTYSYYIIYNITVAMSVLHLETGVLYVFLGTYYLSISK